MAQDDPVLMTVNGREVTRAEFAAAYLRARQQDGERTLKQFALLFADRKLKAVAGEAAGLDTLPAFKAACGAYRSRLAAGWLPGKERIERLARQVYDEQKAARCYEQVTVCHIFKYLPQNVTGSRLRQVEAQMDSLYRALQQPGGAGHFEEYVQRYSDEKLPFRVGHLQMPVEFEQAVDSLETGAFSPPFFTPQGIHIVRLLERHATPPFEALYDSILRSQPFRMKLESETVRLVEELKKEGATVPAKGDKAFGWFAMAHPAAASRQWDAFVRKSLLDDADSRLEQRYPELRFLVQAYRDSLLAADATRRAVDRLAQDGAGMQAYREKHRADYRGERSCYRGIVLHGISKRVVKQARKFLKQLPEEEWLDAIRLTFNAGETPQLSVEQGVFAPGDNPYVDEQIFKRIKAAPQPSFPFTLLLGKKIKEPENVQQAQERVAADYRKQLEQGWTAHLRAAGKVEINQEVLKTVNNH